MTLAVKLTVITGPHNRDRYCIREKTTCVIGRGESSLVRLWGTEKDTLISRKHCRLTIDPPEIRVLDLGSLNGTFVNGNRVHPQLPGAEGEGLALADGDILTIGGTTIQVHIIDCGSYVQPVGRRLPLPSSETPEEGSFPACHGDCLKGEGAQVLGDGLTVLWKT